MLSKALSGNERKYRFMNVEVDVTEEDMEAYRPPKRQKSDPMNKIGSDKLPDYAARLQVSLLCIRAFFGGHHGHHGVKTFTIMTLNGLNFVSNVYSCRRSDCRIIEWTNI
jgi:hypothetical protein